MGKYGFAHGAYEDRVYAWGECTALLVQAQDGVQRLYERGGGSESSERVLWALSAALGVWVPDEEYGARGYFDAEWDVCGCSAV